MPYVKNLWYAAGWSADLEPNALLSRRIVGEGLVFFRQRNGTAVALENRCAHRFAPLNMGCVVDAGLRCGYHGLVFGPDGTCVHNPQGPVPRAARVRSFPVAEQNGLIWVWMGDPDGADRTPLPDYSFLDAAKSTARITGYMHTRSNYEIMYDNIMDLSHIDFLHTTTLGSGSIAKVTPRVHAGDGDEIVIRWRSDGQKAAPVYDPYLPEPGGRVDQTLEVRWRAPGLMLLVNSLQPEGHGEDAQLVSTNVHLVTPETETTTHYFYGGIRNFNEDDAKMNAQRAKAIEAAFRDEDKPMVEAVQANMGHETDILALKPVLLPSDAGAVQARRTIRRLLAQESAALA